MIVSAFVFKSGSMRARTIPVFAAPPVALAMSRTSKGPALVVSQTGYASEGGSVTQGRSVRQPKGSLGGPGGPAARATRPEDAPTEELSWRCRRARASRRAALVVIRRDGVGPQQPLGPDLGPGRRAGAWLRFAPGRSR